MRPTARRNTMSNRSERVACIGMTPFRLIGPNPGVFNTSHQGAEVGATAKRGDLFFEERRIGTLLRGHCLVNSTLVGVESVQAARVRPKRSQLLIRSQASRIFTEKNIVS